jgi:hypothetical protein
MSGARISEWGSNMAAIQLSEEVGMYVDRLRAEFEAIETVWLIGDRVNEQDARESRWELLAFADDAALGALRDDRDWHRGDILLSIVIDGDRFEPAWQASGTETEGGGSLEKLGWRADTAQTATYSSRVKSGARRRAVRVR